MPLFLFWKRNFKYLCPGILLLGMLYGVYQVILPGHVLNGDFALYIRQAISIVNGDMQHLQTDMQSMIAASSYQRYSPILYPWGYPLLLSIPFACVGIDYTVFKILGIVLMTGAYICLYVRILRSGEGGLRNAIAVLSLTAGNLFYWCFGNYVSSESAFFFFLTLAFLLIHKWSKNPESYSPVSLLLLGVLMLFVSQIRTEGYLLFLSLAVIQLIRKMRGYRLWLPYVGALGGWLLFFVVFPAGYLTHLEHLKALTWNQILTNLLSIYQYPSSLFYLPYEWINTVFWSLCVVGMGVAWSKYVAEIVYLLACFCLLTVWPYAEMRYWFSLFPFCILFFIEGISFFAIYVNSRIVGKTVWVVSLLLSVWVWGHSFYLVPNKEEGYTPNDPNVEGADATEVFDFIRTHAAPGDWIACGESRAVYLYTDRLCANVSGGIEGLDGRFDWYIVFRHRTTYLQYHPKMFRFNKKTFDKVFQNETFTVYKIMKICKQQV